jgi:hypothetical protein
MNFSRRGQILLALVVVVGASALVATAIASNAAFATFRIMPPQPPEPWVLTLYMAIGRSPCPFGSLNITRLGGKT